LDQVAILGQFADEWIDLPQTERSLRAALQIAAHEAVLGNAQLQRRRTDIIASRAAILLDQLENALDATYSEFALASMYGIAASTDVGSCLVCTRRQLKQLRRRTTRAICIADAMPAALAAQMLAQQLTGFRIKQSHEHRVPLHMYLASYPAQRRSVVSSFNFDPAIQVNRALSILAVAERLQRQSL
jgi:hypothetical protein